MILFKPASLNKLFLTLAFIAILLAILLYTDPTRIPLPLLVLPFLLVGLIVNGLMGLLLDKLAIKVKPFVLRFMPISMAFMVVAMLLLRSLHQLTLNDSLLVCGFTAAFWLYVWRADFLRK